MTQLIAIDHAAFETRMERLERQNAEILAKLVALQKPAPKPTRVTIRQAARHLGVSIATVNRMLSDGRLTRIKVGRSTRIDAAEVMALSQGAPGVEPGAQERQKS